MRLQNSQVIAESVLVVGGILIVGFTLHLYPAFETTFPASTRPSLPPAEADHQIESARSYLANHPDDFNTYIALAMAYYQKGPDYYIEALNALEKSRALGATDPHLFFYAGVMYDALGLADYAINEYSKYLRHRPNDYETMIRLANLYFRQKKYEEANTLYKESLRAWPKDATAWFNSGVINIEKGDYPAALKCLAEAEKIGGHLPEGGLFEEGEIYRLKGEADKAFQFYQQELAQHPNYVPALEATAAMVQAKGDWKQARALRRRIAELKKQQTQSPATAPVAIPATAPSPKAAAVPEVPVKHHVGRRHLSPATVTPPIPVAPAAPTPVTTNTAPPSAAPSTVPPPAAATVQSPATPNMPANPVPVAPAIPAAPPTTSSAPASSNH